jgi:hypothetical protein
MLSYRVCPLPLPALQGVKRFSVRLLGYVLPKNDPDFHLQEQSVAYWWLELDSDSLVAQREIGFGTGGLIVRYAPAGRNWGIFVGEELSGSHFADVLTQQDFEEAWTRAKQSITVKA